MTRRTANRAAPQVDPKEQNAQLGTLGASAIDGSHPEWAQCQSELIDNMKEARARLEAGAGQKVVDEETSQRINRDRQFAPNHAALYFPDTKTALEATRRAFANMAEERDSTRLPEPTAEPGRYNFGSEVFVRGVDPSRLKGDDGPQLDARTPSMIPVSLRVSIPLRHYEPADIEVMNAHCDKHDIPKPRIQPDAEGPGESICLDVTTTIVRPVERQLTPKLENGVIDFEQKPGLVVADYLDRETSREFLRNATANLEDPSKVPAEFTVANSRALKALGVDRSAGQMGPPALDVLDGKLAQLTEPERRKVVSEAHKVGANLYTAARTGILQGAGLSVTVKGMDDLVRKGLGIPSPTVVPGREPQPIGEGSKAKLSVVGEGSLLPSNVSRLAVKLGGMIPANEIVSIRPNPFRSRSTMKAHAVVAAKQVDRAAQVAEGAKTINRPPDRGKSIMTQASLPVTTRPLLEGRTIKREIGIVVGRGQPHSSSYSSPMKHWDEIAIEALREQAAALGADAVLALRLTFSITGPATEGIAYGTAIVLHKDAP